MPDQEPTTSSSNEFNDGEEVNAESRAESGSAVDQLGIPMSREPTLDDVRGDSESHRRLALGCTVAVVGAVIGFWVIRVLWLG